MDEPSSPVRLNEKWISIIIWLALLLLLFYTSSSGVLSGFGGNVGSFFNTFLGFTGPTGTIQENYTPAFVGALVYLAMTGVLIWQLVTAWMQFIELTNTLLIAFVERSLPGESNPIFFEMLNFKETAESEGEEDAVVVASPTEAIGSMAGNILRPIAYMWVIIVATPSIVIFTTMLVR